MSFSNTALKEGRPFSLSNLYEKSTSLAVKGDPSENNTSLLSVKITHERSSGYSISFAINPYAESISSDVPSSRLSKNIDEYAPALPFLVYGCIESNDPNAQKEISPPFGASGFT